MDSEEDYKFHCIFDFGCTESRRFIYEVENFSREENLPETLCIMAIGGAKRNATNEYCGHTKDHIMCIEIIKNIAKYNSDPNVKAKAMNALIYLTVNTNYKDFGNQEIPNFAIDFSLSSHIKGKTRNEIVNFFCGYAQKKVNELTAESFVQATNALCGTHTFGKTGGNQKF